MKYLIIMFFSLLLSGCGLGCDTVIEVVPNEYTVTDLYHQHKKLKKYFTIINHTDKTYENNGLYSIVPKFEKKELEYLNHYVKIKIIKPKQKINKNEKVLYLYPGYSGGGYPESVSLFCLDGRKIFFGAYKDAYKVVWGEVTSDCKRHFIKFDVHPVWQERDLTIHIYEDKITFSDPKIKEVKKLKLTKTEEVDPNTLELVDCSKE